MKISALETKLAQIAEKIDMNKPHNRTILDFLKRCSEETEIAYDASRLLSVGNGETNPIGLIFDSLSPDHIIISARYLPDYIAHLKHNARENGIKVADCRLFWKHYIFSELKKVKDNIDFTALNVAALRYEAYYLDFLFQS
jgi:hypothetical protein